jgi:hypothetical protein
MGKYLFEKTTDASEESHVTLRDKKAIGLRYKGVKLTEQERARIISCIENAIYPSINAIARACGVSRKTISDMLARDPELEKHWHEAQAAQLDDIEESAFDQAKNGANEMASERMKEFLLSRLRPEKFGEASALNAAAGRMPQIVVPFKITGRRTDENTPITVNATIGISDAPQNASEPKKIETVDVSESPISDT